MFKKQLIAAMIITVVVASLMTTPVFAGNGNNGKCPGGERPGWGYGDDNHEHSGPPGQGDNGKPGWGFGDNNHEHSGPPGQSDNGKPSWGFGNVINTITGLLQGKTMNK
jgi:hypothetical protein